VFTKADKQSLQKGRQTMDAYRKVLLKTWDEAPEMMLTSAESGHGREELLTFLDDCLKNEG
jgi:GTP-binding protein